MDIKIAKINGEDWAKFKNFDYFAVMNFIYIEKLEGAFFVASLIRKCK